MNKQYTAQQKAKITLEILKEEKGMTQISSEYGIHPSQLYRWKTQASEGLVKVFENEANRTEKEQREAHERQVQELYSEIGRLNTQLNWLKKKSGIVLPEM